MEDEIPPTAREAAVDRKERLIEEIASEARQTAGETGRSRFSERVMAAMRAVPREEFVPAHLRHRAYDNSPLPIGEDQTISQPFIVALMTDLLDPEPGDRVLEVGTGCGYQAAVLAEAVGEVYTIEYLSGLGQPAAERLRRLGYDNVHVRIGNGRAGWPEAAPFDGILVTAGAEDVPQALVDQLAPGGRLVIPVGRGLMGQDLQVVSKDGQGRVSRESVLPVAFVRLEGG
jgi:protein-L-isoaspartate(D-aspartate) O-methyltransferase